MRNAPRSFLLCFVFALCAAVLSSAGAKASPAEASARPRVIAYIEPGHFWLYSSTYDALQKALEERGVKAEYPQALHVSLDWKASPEQMRAAAAELLKGRPDLVIAAGTAGVRAMLAVNDGATPIIGIALADPLAAGLVKSPEDSGVDNFTCEVIPDRWRNMYRVFHDVVGFRALGVMYPAGPEGRVYAGVDDALLIGKQAGFSVLEEVIADESEASCKEGLRRLHERGADAFFIGPLNCFDWSLTDPTPLFDLLNKTYQLPTFARDGSLFVQGGALMGFATWDFTPTGRQLAEAAEKIFTGTKPRDIPMRGSVEPLIALNLQTARELGIDLPFDVLVAADEIYETTIKPAMR